MLGLFSFLKELSWQHSNVVGISHINAHILFIFHQNKTICTEVGESARKISPFWTTAIWLVGIYFEIIQKSRLSAGLTNPEFHTCRGLFFVLVNVTTSDVYIKTKVLSDRNQTFSTTRSRWLLWSEMLLKLAFQRLILLFPSNQNNWKPSPTSSMVMTRWLPTCHDHWWWWFIYLHCYIFITSNNQYL